MILRKSRNLCRWISRDPIGESGGVNLYGYVLNNPINLYDPLGLRDYTAQETQDLFLTPAFQSSTAGSIQGLIDILNNSKGRGPYDFGWNEHAGDTFCVNGTRYDADQFGNYIAGYQGEAYDQYVFSLFPALPTVYLAGLYYHLRGDTKATNDPFDTTGFPYIHQGSNGVPESWAVKNGVYDTSPVP